MGMIEHGRHQKDRSTGPHSKIVLCLSLARPVLGTVRGIALDVDKGEFMSLLRRISGLFGLKDRPTSSNNPDDYGKSDPFLDFTRALIDFIEISTEQEIFECIAREMQRLANDAHVFVFARDEKTGRFSVQAVPGLDLHLEPFQGLMGEDPLDFSYLVTDEALGEMKKGGFSEISSFFPFGAGTLSEKERRSIGKKLGIEAAYSMGIIRREDFFGFVVVLKRKAPFSRPRAEALVTAASVVLQRKRMEKALREAERKEQNESRIGAMAIATSLNAIAMTDLEGRLTYANHSFLGMCGYASVSEVLGRHMAEFCDEAADISAAVSELSEKGSWVGEVELRRKNDTFFEAELSASLVFGAQGSPLCLMASFADISERKQSEREMRVAIEAADMANLAKSRFLANMSHEFRTPLNGITGLTEMTLETELSEEQRDNLNLIKTSTDSLRAVINDVLDFSKIEAGKLDLDPLPFSLRGCVASLRTLLPLATEKGLKFAWYVRSEVPDSLIGDSMRLRQVLVNLVSNAIKFTSEGEVVVMASLDSSKDGQVVVQFSVTDSGIGIPEEKKQRIFESFEQADASMSRRYGGTGLGLTISSKLVEMMGGRIWIRSDIGVGTVFHFTARFELNPFDFHSPREGDKKLFLPSLKILLAEDNPVNQKMAIRMLEKREHAVILARDGQEALELWQNNFFDLVLMDVMMPNLNGLEATAAIREREKNDGGHCAIVAMTANAMKGDREICLDAGMDGYVAKPIQSQTLFEEIAQVLGSLHSNHLFPPVR
ncbi:MAG TPA: hypothetical protein DD435_06785 [Cyanobacteria bacterium UBA8530]|nr:hypothetical protein [Cyanobacteria bacterium UBA8530]